MTDILEEIDTCHQKILQDITLKLTVPEDINRVLLPFLSSCADTLCDCIDGQPVTPTYEPIATLCTRLSNILSATTDEEVNDDLKTQYKHRVHLIFVTFPFGSNGEQAARLSNEIPQVDDVSARNNTA